MGAISITKALNPAYRKFKPVYNDIDKFKVALLNCLEAIEISDKQNESEEHIKEPIKLFLKSTFYQDNLINTKGRIDLAIYLGDTAKTDIGVIIEAKRPSNKAEFISKDNLNKKALQELLLYYLRERIDQKNNNIKHLIITNGLEWFFFKAEDFYSLFYKNSSLVKEYIAFRDGLKDTSRNELFYDEIASKYIKEIQDKLPFVHLELNKEELNSLNETKTTEIYKLFSNVHLLGHSFGNDSNKLNESFYKELLHIIGLEEVKESSKKVIIRKSEKDRDYASLLENTIFTLEDKDYLHRVKGFSGVEDKSFAIGLEICINWINRILFLKLLESQLVSYNNSEDYRFLNFTFLDGYDALNDLFFSALAKPLPERHVKYKDKFKNIPYLNSSLFEHSELEKQAFDISALKDEEMEIFSLTVLKDASGNRLKGKLSTLKYIFLFLDAYDFSADANTDFENRQENKTLINASVLGLIFEKINGYKDGSFYTPGYITMFMCKEAIRKAVVDKFKQEYNGTIETFEDVKDYCSQYFKKADLVKFNQTINSLKICDPAVGSGHFLVSALNEVIAIKSELNILCNEEGNRIPCEISIEQDELYIAYNEGELFEYQRHDVNSLTIQKTLFHEKQSVIENCLFGVDINPNSVNICRLRLWIELLKNAYYTSTGELQTLPNIDINIKCGNSLISRFSLEDSLKAAFKNKEVIYSIEDYKMAVNNYKKTNSKTKKIEIQNIIDTIKSNFKTTLNNKTKEDIERVSNKYETERQRLINLELFGEKIKKVEKDNLKKLKIRADKANLRKEEILNNVIYQDSFEWRFEFPEVLDDEGNYIGFDVVIGNPPYIQLQKMGKASDVLQQLSYLTFARTGDIYSLFYELGNNILKNKGVLIFITSNKWMRAAYGESLRKYLIDYTNPLILIDFGGIQVFDSATVDTNILMFTKEKNRQQTQACIVKGKVLNNLSIYFEQFSHLTDFQSSESWVVLSPIEKQIIEKIEAAGTPLKEWNININYGIKTGFNEAFIISKEKRKELIEKDPKSVEIIRPILRGRDIKRYGYDFADKYLICARLIAEIPINYPAINEHLTAYIGSKQLGDNSTTKVFKRPWWSWMQEPINYWDNFFGQKIIYPNMTKFLPFYLDDKSFMHNDKSFMITGENIAYLTAFLNSSLFKYCFIDNFPELQGGTRELRKVFLDKIPVLQVSKNINLEFEKLVSEVQELKSNQLCTTEIELEIDRRIFELYSLSEEEKDIIGFIEIK
ncbi:DUF7149 domain-containing protein [Myroides odoratimimus]|uniref:site-specific DNA-methyltransferase (adenine-specific) n=1 Tax=Myroides odoratimimus TaxID=76832 RepID=A0AAI8G4T3_9FLAO|nr:Eco57I restriction-modification methylase domain-containing protein [Myroides odoratimimus]ALU26046.1 hypothetical protein AS202_07755 [Myroides odoratimimus]